MHVIYINFIGEKVLLETISLDNLYKFRYIHDKINLILMPLCLQMGQVSTLLQHVSQRTQCPHENR